MQQIVHLNQTISTTLMNLPIHMLFINTLYQQLEVWYNVLMKQLKEKIQKVTKFGGSSLASAPQLKKIAISLR